jgi:hypothetical protein
MILVGPCTLASEQLKEGRGGPNPLGQLGACLTWYAVVRCSRCTARAEPFAARHARGSFRPALAHCAVNAIQTPPCIFYSGNHE